MVTIGWLKRRHPFFQMRSVDGGRSVLLVGIAPRDPQKEWAAAGKPVLSFSGVGHCALAQVWNGTARSAYAVPRPKLGRDEEPTHTAVVVMRSGKGTTSTPSDTGMRRHPGWRRIHYGLFGTVQS